MFEVQKKEFLTALGIVSRAVPSRPTHPILGHVKIIVDADVHELTMTGFDLAMGISVTIDCHATESREITLPATLLSSVILKLPGEEFTMELTKQEETTVTVEIIAGASRTELRGFTAEDYPDFPSLVEPVYLTLPCDVLSQGLKSVAFAASVDETKQILTGVNIATTAEGLTFAATNGHRLAEKTITKGNSNLDSFNLTLPAAAMAALIALLLERSGGTVKIEVGEERISFSVGERTLICRKLEGKYPNYKQFLPVNPTTTVIVDKKNLLSSMKLVSVIGNTGKYIALDIKGEMLAISAIASEIGASRDQVPAQIIGDEIQVGVDPKYASDILRAINGDQIQIELFGSTKPILFKPVDESDLATYLVMPVQVRD